MEKTHAEEVATLKEQILQLQQSHPPLAPIQFAAPLEEGTSLLDHPPSPPPMEPHLEEPTREQEVMTMSPLQMYEFGSQSIYARRNAKWEEKVCQSVCHTYLTSKDLEEYIMPTLPYSLLKRECELYVQKNLVSDDPTQVGGYNEVTDEAFNTSAFNKMQPLWRRRWFKEYPTQLAWYKRAPKALRIDPSYCPIKRRKTWEDYEHFHARNPQWLNYPSMPAPRGNPMEDYVITTMEKYVEMLKDVLDFTCKIFVNILTMLLACLKTFERASDIGDKWNRFP